MRSSTPERANFVLTVSAFRKRGFSILWPRLNTQRHSRATGFLFHMTVLASKPRRSTHVAACSATIHASVESPPPGANLLPRPATAFACHSRRRDRQVLSIVAKSLLNWSRMEPVMRVFVAGASGAIGEPLIAELLKQGHSVVGMTSSEARAKNLERQGAEAAIVNAFDAAGSRRHSETQTRKRSSMN
jgi:hypothetical protein